MLIIHNKKEFIEVKMCPALVLVNCIHVHAVHVYFHLQFEDFIRERKSRSPRKHKVIYLGGLWVNGLPQVSSPLFPD